MRTLTTAIAILALAACAPEREAPEPAPEPADVLAALPPLPDNLTDSHYHLKGVGEREVNLNLAGVGTLDELLDRLAAHAARYPEHAWIYGRGWLETHFDPPVFPTRHDLDTVIPGRPVYLERGDGHGGVANSMALEVAGITRDTEAPFGGQILKDEDGEPTGMLIDNAQNLVEMHIENAGRLDTKEAIRIGGEVAARQGWSTVHSVMNNWGEIVALDELFDEGRMPVRVYPAIRWPGEGAERLLDNGPQQFAHFTLRAIKINLDGALGSRGAALLDDYADDPGNRGHLTHTPEELRPVLERALRNGIQVWTHAIGDRANRLILDLYEEAFDKVPVDERAVPDPRWRIEHAQHLTAEDIPRFAELGVIASMQPSHSIGDLHFAVRRLDPERLQYAYAWRALIDSGAIVIGGSDAPVEVGDPRIEFHAATTRTDLKGYSGEGWHPEQAVTWEVAVKMFTEWAEYGAFVGAD